MNKFKHFKCDTCNKETDVDNNITHAFIDRCNLTVGCNGTLRFVADKNVKDTILNFDSAVQLNKIGVTAEDISLPTYIDLASDSANSVTLALPISAADNAVATVTFNEVLNKETAFKEFTFSVGVPVVVISGKDTSVDQKVLTFNDTDSLAVFINGQEIDESTYSANNNLIRFNETITYNTYSASSLFIKVLVFSKEDAVVKTLAFNRNVQGLTDSSWSNISTAEVSGEVCDLFTCVSLLSLDLNSRLSVTKVEVNGQEIELGRANFLLAQAPFGPLDRITSQVINAQALDGTLNHVKYEVSSNKAKISATSISLSNIFPPIKPIVSFVSGAELDSSGLVADDLSLNTNIPKNNSFIIGPV